MLLLTATTQKIQLVTSAAVNVDVYACGIDKNQSSGAISEFTQLTAITTAATTDVVAAPAATTTRNVKTIKARNKSTTTSVDLTVLINVSATLYELVKITIRPGETLEYVEGVGFFVVAGPSAPAKNFSTADQTLNAADTYITGSLITIATTRPVVVGTVFKWQFTFTKTGAGIAGPVFSVRFGTAGSTADTARLTFTGAAQTGVIDAATVDIWAIVRGPIGAATVVSGECDLHHNLSATGFSTTAHDILQVTSAGFDITTVTAIGVSANPGASGVWTCTMALAEVANI